MSTISIKLDTQHVFDPRLGVHALTEAQVAEMAPRMAGVLGQITEERKGGKHRFRDLPHERSGLEEVLRAVEDYRDTTDNLLVLGIGGSALGNIALHSALNPSTYNMLSAERRKGPRLFVMDNIDPVHFEAVLEFVGQNWARTLVNVISKSGETAETSAQFLIVRRRMIEALGEAEADDRIIVTTDAKAGTMRGIVDRQEYRSLVVPDGVGGRFSVLSPVGLFSAAMCGIDVRKLLAGAANMDQAVSDPDP